MTTTTSLDAVVTIHSKYGIPFSLPKEMKQLRNVIKYLHRREIALDEGAHGKNGTLENKTIEIGEVKGASLASFYTEGEAGGEFHILSPDFSSVGRFYVQMPFVIKDWVGRSLNSLLLAHPEIGERLEIHSLLEEFPREKSAPISTVQSVKMTLALPDPRFKPYLDNKWFNIREMSGVIATLGKHSDHMNSGWVDSSSAYVRMDFSPSEVDVGKCTILSKYGCTEWKRMGRSLDLEMIPFLRSKKTEILKFITDNTDKTTIGAEKNLIETVLSLV
jgi:hypothetical protein